jgi:predicted nucleic acid-binding protein
MYLLDTNVVSERRKQKPHGRRSDALYEDAMIAATAIRHELIVVTRNLRDFGVRLLNPFTV